MKCILFAPAFSFMMAVAQNSSSQNTGDITLNVPSAVSGTKANKAAKVGISNRKINTVELFIRSDKNLVPVAITAVDIKAVRHFSRVHKNIENPKWYRSDVGFVALFMEDGKETRSVYKDNGEWFYNFSSYREDKMDIDLRHMVKSRFYDNTILFIYQYNFENKKVYIIRMSDKNEKIVSIQVCDGIIEDLSSSGPKTDSD